MHKDEQNEILDVLNRDGNLSSLDNRYDRIKKLFKTALEISPEDHINMLATINDRIDESVSKTINLKYETLPDEIYDNILLAYQKRINGITFFRDGCLEDR